MTFEEREKLEILMNKVRYVQRASVRGENLVIIEESKWNEFYAGLKELRDNDRKFETRT